MYIVAALMSMICISVISVGLLDLTIGRLTNDKSNLQATIENERATISGLALLLEQVSNASQRYQEQYRLLLKELVGWDYFWENIDPLIGDV